MDDNKLELLFLKYNLALNTLKSQFNSLNLEYSLLGGNNPIEHIKYRIKTKKSIAGKLAKRGCEISSETIEKELRDVVGVRIICSFLSDKDQIIQRIRDNFDVIVEKDYITKPKDTGYTSYHMIVKVPIQIGNERTFVTAEIQVRTIAMDMWASLEHKIWYKKNVDLPPKMMDYILKTAQVSTEIDETLDQLVQELEVTPIIPISYQDIPKINEKRYKLSMLKYEYALKKLEDKFRLLSEEYARVEYLNPIEHMKSRIKTRESIFKKLNKQGRKFNIENIEKHINDVAGLRIVCSFQSDLYELIDWFKSDIAREGQLDPNFKIITEKDYVALPKESGYSSYHILVQVPIYLQSGITYAKVEIQIRTIAMDMWASLEHKLCYQRDYVDPTIRQKLKDTSEIIRIIDENMDYMLKEIHCNQNFIEDTNKKRKILLPTSNNTK